MRAPRGQGISTFGGAVSLPGVQVGFPAKITSAFDADTGYSWERMAVTTGVVDATSPLTGAYAFALDGNESVAADSVVFLEPDAGGQGWTFQTPTGDSGSDGDLPGSVACRFAALRTTDCLLLSDDGDDAYLTYSGGTWSGTNDRGTWVFDFDAAIGLPYLTLGGTRLMYCGNNCFTGGAFTGHLADNNGGADECTGNVFTVCLACSCCPIDGWDGAGWYCIEDTGPTDCFVAELLDEDVCDGTITICSGPYASQIEALAACVGEDIGVASSGSCNAGADNPLGSAVASFFETNGVVGGSVSFIVYWTFPVTPGMTYKVDAALWTDSYNGGAAETGNLSFAVESPAVGTGFLNEPAVANTVELHCFDFYTGPSQTVACIKVTTTHVCSPGMCTIKTRYAFTVNEGAC